MKKLGLLISFILMMSSQTWAQRQGGESSGGGGGFVCRNGAGAVTSVELLDLWESSFVYSWNTTNSVLPYQQQIDAAVAKLKLFIPTMGLQVEATLPLMQARLTAVPVGVTVPTPTDTGHLFQKPGCPLEGLMYYSGLYGKLFYVDEYFQNLSETHKAAMLLHEAIYYLLREHYPYDPGFPDYYYEKDSIRTRKIVACLMSSDCLPSSSIGSIVSGMTPTYHCDNANVSYDAYTSSSSNTLAIVFTKLSGLALGPNSIFGISDYQNNYLLDYNLVLTSPPSPYGIGLNIGNSNIEKLAFNNKTSYPDLDFYWVGVQYVNSSNFIELGVWNRSDFSEEADVATFPLTCTDYP